MFEVKVITGFKDLECNVDRVENEMFTVNSIERLKALTGSNPRKIKLVEITKAKKRFTNKNAISQEDNKILLYQDCLYKIGGIETFLYNFVKGFKEKNITVSTKIISTEQVILLSEYADIIIDNGHHRFEYDITILGNCSSETVIPRLKTKKIYQMIHADWSEMIKVEAYSNYTWNKNSAIDQIICV